MAGYPQIHTQAQIVVVVGDEIRRWGWSDARKRKAQVAAWLRAQDLAGNVKISATIKQRAAEVPWRDGGNWYWQGPGKIGLEYAAQALLGTPEWGGSR